MWISKNSTNTVLILRSSCVEFVWKMRSVSATSVSRVYFQTTKETTNTASDNMADCAFHGITTHRRRVVWRACSIVDPSFRRLYKSMIVLLRLRLEKLDWHLIVYFANVRIGFAFLKCLLPDMCEVCHPRDRSKAPFRKSAQFLINYTLFNETIIISA